MTILLCATRLRDVLHSTYFKALVIIWVHTGIMQGFQ